MPHITDEELDKLNREVDLVALVRSKGIELKAASNGTLIGLSPFKKEKVPGFAVEPERNQWWCKSSRMKGGAIDFIMKYDGVSQRHAVLLLKEQNPQLYGNRQSSGRSGPLSKATVPKLDCPLSVDTNDQTLFKQALDYYQDRLNNNQVALDYLKFRGIWSEEAIKKFGVGFADRTLGLRLPHKNRREGAQIRERLQRLGLYRESGHEHFNGCLVFPIHNETGEVKQIYGRKIGRQKNKVFHLYLPGPKHGIWNPDCLTSPEIILTECVIDALTFWVNGFHNVTCIYGTDGFTDEHLQAFKEKRTQKIYLAYDRDGDGNKAAERDAQRLNAIGIECFRILFPPGQDLWEMKKSRCLSNRPVYYGTPF